jgi:hypothetical protein
VDLAVYCADVGSIRNKHFGWARAARGNVPRSPSISEKNQHVEDLVKSLEHDLRDGIPIALGFECPLYVPVPDDHTLLGTRRCGEKNRPWSAGGGVAVLATGLVQAAWVLSELRKVSPKGRVFLDWDDFCEQAEPNGGRHLLFLWEAFAPNQGEKGNHPQSDVRVAKRGVDSFTRGLRASTWKDAISSACDPRPLSLIGAAVIWSGWSKNLNLIHESCLVLQVSAA